MPYARRDEILDEVIARMPRKPKATTTQESLFTERLNHLFTTRRAPDGKPYALRAVAQETGISASYLSNLRAGKVALPGLDKIEALARFFGVPATYFMGPDAAPTGEVRALTGDEELRRALDNPLVKELALQAGRFGPEEWKHMLAILEHQVALQRLIEERVRREYEQAASPAAPMPAPERPSSPRHSRARKGPRPKGDRTVGRD